MGEYKDKSVIVTGGAGHIGRAISEAYLCAGANVVICGRREPSKPVEADGRSAVFVKAVIREAAQSQKVIDQRMAGLGVAVIALLLKAPFPVVVISAAATSAAIFHLG